ncbi:hypothetical protein FGG08_003969 [Glutinoglossum americanum]|uniref:Uncharacterized protein n=1 Tax=Glutinoglossum americanum TaxID=1670608 RepID=A0A9P8I6L0_9PEZI|nr:hypothetical protein FGG08_003969 [Glutinoglossum americanum]
MAIANPPLPDVLPVAIPGNSRASDDSPPIPIPQPIGFPPFPLPKPIRTGSWLVNYQPANSTTVAYDGTIRIENNSAGRTASGDLYQRPVFVLPGGPFPPRPPFPPIPPHVLLRPPPNPANGIPIQSRGNYRYYLRITRIDEFLTTRGTFDMGIQMYRYQATSKTDFSFTKDTSDYNVKMTWMTVPLGSGYPSPSDYAEGDVKSDTTGAVVGRLKMGWVSEFFRKCKVEIDTVSGSERPLDNGAGQNWQTVFKNVGLDLSVELSDTDVLEKSGDSWSDGELHQAMLEKREPVNLDEEWHYYILVVKELDDPAFGVMFDWSSTDSNNVAREGVGIGSHIMTPDTDNWGVEKNKRFGTAKAPYFRTAVHELGHAFGLLHNVVESDNSFMNRTLTIVSKGTPANPFPNNIKWNYADENLMQLRHWPDIYVRPGGVEFGLESNTNPPISPQDEVFEMPDLDLEVTPLLGEVPLGAPVRVNVKLTNKGKEPALVPSDIGFKSGYVSGTVTHSSRITRSFKPLVCYDKQPPLKNLGAGESISTSLTLLRGGQGALFPSSGIADIIVRVGWGLSGGAAATVVGSRSVLVTPPLDKSHAAAAHKLLTTPDVHLVLVLGGDHLDEGVDAIRKALQDKTLRPHYASVEARRRCQKFYDRAADVGSASSLIDADVVMSHIERAKLEKMGVDCGSVNKYGNRPHS